MTFSHTCRPWFRDVGALVTLLFSLASASCAARQRTTALPHAHPTGRPSAAEHTAGSLPTPATVQFRIVPMRLAPAPGASGEDARMDLELRADGTLFSHGQFVGQLSGNRVLGSDGREIIAIAPDGGVSIHGTAVQFRLTDAGEVVRSNGATLRIADDGTPWMTTPSSGQPPERAPLRFTGFRPEARRTAGLLAILAGTVSLP
jgi:hypothetical protein